MNLDPDFINNKLIPYIHAMESAICGEFHTDNYPDCSENHDKGRAILTHLHNLAITERVARGI